MPTFFFPVCCKGPISLAWRLGGDSSLHWLRRRLCDVPWRPAGSPGSRRKFKHVRFFFWGETFSVSSRYQRRLRDVRAQAMFWSPESPRLISLGSRGDVSLVRAQANFWSPESPELPQLISHGDVSASEIEPLKDLLKKISSLNLPLLSHSQVMILIGPEVKC